MLTWHYFAVATVLFGSLSNIVIRVIMKKEESDPILFTIVFQFILTAIVLIYALFRGFVFPPPAFLWPRLLLSALLYAAGSLCGFYSSKHLSAGENSIITASGALITVLLGVFMLGESFNIGKVAGVACIIISIVVLYAKERMKMNRGVWYALGVAFFYGVAVVNDVVVIKSYSAISFVPVMSFLPGVILSLVFPKKALSIGKLLNLTSLAHITLYSLVYAASAITFYQALSVGAFVSQLSPMSRASIIVTVLLAALFLGERKNLSRKILSAVLVSVGVILLA
jgi:drug/metabolite transporter (DMT)-like permease